MSRTEPIMKMRCGEGWRIRLGLSVSDLKEWWYDEGDVRRNKEVEGGADER